MTELGGARDQKWVQLTTARTAFEQQVASAYDEVLLEVAERVRSSGSIGKSDIGALLLWKRLRADTPWARWLMSVPDVEVRATTAQVVGAVRDPRVSTPAAAREGRRLLTSLPGFTTGDALASAVLVAAAPRRMAVYDRRSHRGLELLGETLSSSPGRYGCYMQLIDELLVLAHRHDDSWLARDVDLAFYWIGGA